MNKKLWRNLKDFLRLLLPQKRRFFWAAFFLSISTVLSFASPLFPKVFIDYVLKAGSKGYFYLKITIIALALCFIIREVTNKIYQYLILLFQKRVSFVLELKLFRHILNQSLSFFKERNIGYLMSRISGDVGKLQGLMAQTILDILTSLVYFIVGLIIALYLSWKLTLMCLAILPFFVWSIKFFSSKIRNKSKELSEVSAQNSSVLQEALSGVYVIKSFLIEIFQARKLAQTMRKVIKTEVSWELLNYYSSFTTAVIGMIAPIFVFWYGGKEVLSGQLTLGSLISFNMILGYVFGPAKKLVNINTTIQSSLGALERVYEYFDLKPEINGKRKHVQLSGVEDAKTPDSSRIFPPKADFRTRRAETSQTEFPSEISLKDVSFSYDGNGKVLEDINLDIKAGEIIALVGRSGGGKTTLCNLIPRFYEPQQGEILFDNISIKEIDLKGLRSLIGIVPQETFMFSGTIEDNVRIGNLKATKEEIKRACQQANLGDLINSLPKGYEAKIGECGAKLSGGQRQRIAIARTLLKDPRIIILDEATSHLDSITEKEVQGAFSNLFKDRITFIIAHRLSTAIKANRILVVDEGKIIDQGKHQELYQRCSLYKVLCDLHFSV